MAGRQQQRDLPGTIQYEDFVPKSEWKEEAAATLLLLHLPGFSKEEIRVTYVHSLRTIRVDGQRPLTAAGASNAKRWSRFSQTFSVPENCLVEEIHGIFKNSVLTITMPKQMATPKPSDIPEDSRKEKETKRRPREASSEISSAKTTFSPPKPPAAEEKKKFLEETKGKKVLELQEKKLPEVSHKKPGAMAGAELGLEQRNSKKEKGIIEKIRAKEMMTNEDKKLLVNIGVAAVVIFALGAYVSYTFSSSSSSSSSPASSSSSTPSSKPE